MGKFKYNREETELLKTAFLQELEKSRGVIKYACDATGLSRDMVSGWQQSDREFSQAFNDIIEGAIDFVESQLFAHMKRGSTAAVIFYLKTKGKHRGYVERSEVDTNPPAMANLDPSKLSDKALDEILENYEIKRGED